MSDVTATLTFNALPAFLAALPSAIATQVRAAGTLCYDRTQIEVPVLSGTLKASGTLTVDGPSATVRYSTLYVFFVHFGTHRQSANPFLQRAFDAVAAGASKLMGQAVTLAAQAAGAR